MSIVLRGDIMLDRPPLGVPPPRPLLSADTSTCGEELRSESLPGRRRFRLAAFRLCFEEDEDEDDDDDDDEEEEEEEEAE